DELYAPELLERLARALSPEDVQLFYQTAIIGRRDLPLAPDPRTGFEMTLLRMIAFRPAGEWLTSRPGAAEPAARAGGSITAAGASPGSAASAAAAGGTSGAAGAAGRGEGAGTTGSSGGASAQRCCPTPCVR